MTERRETCELVQVLTGHLIKSEVKGKKEKIKEQHVLRLRARVHSIEINEQQIKDKEKLKIKELYICMYVKSYSEYLLLTSLDQ